jgi:hypothetical protein
MANVTNFTVDGTPITVKDSNAVSILPNQGLTEDQKGNARSNIGAGSSSFSGDYNDLTNKPTIPTVNNATLTIQKNGTNVQTFTANASSNKTANITVPTKVSELTNDSGYTTNTGTVTQVKVGSTAYDPSSGVVSLPAYPTVNNATLTIQKNGTNVQTFTANSSSNKTANITVPTKVSELTNDSGYTTNTGTVTQVKVGSTAYDPSSGVVSLPDYPTVNNAKLTIQKNGTTVKTFTANASSNVTCNITVPTKTSEITNDSSYIADSNQYGSAITSASGLSTSGYPFKIGSHVICSLTSGTSFSDSAVLGTLPSGYRPSAERSIAGSGCVTDNNLSTIPCYFTVKTNGQIVIHTPATRTYYYCTGTLDFVI